ncbi:hypothetical protein ACLI4R_17175 [Natrialbaceae archaeon A-chndr2]
MSYSQSDKIGLVGLAALVGGLFLLMIIVGFINSVQSFLLRIGMPEGFVGDIGSMMFWGLLLLLIFGGGYLAVQLIGRRP